VIGESRDHVSEEGLAHHDDTSARAYNRPRENSSINIFFSSDSICKSTKPNPLLNHQQNSNNNS
jgi:hypothetical protein